jgi:hypothetical protein
LRSGTLTVVSTPDSEMLVRLTLVMLSAHSDLGLDDLRSNGSGQVIVL